MIRTDELRGIIAKNGLSQSDVALKIGVTPKTFYEKMKIGIFGSDEIQIMIDELHIEDPTALQIYECPGAGSIPHGIRERQTGRFAKSSNAHSAGSNRQQCI